MNTQFDEAAGLSVIKDMINTAKRSYGKMNFYFLLWGWLLVIAGVSDYILEQIVHFNYSWIGWPIAMTAGGIISSVHGARQGKKAGVSTYMDRVFAFVWIGFSITLVILIACCVVKGINPAPFILLLTGLPTFVSGGVIKFMPLMLGGMVFWLVGSAFFFLPQEFGGLTFGGAIILGYLVPGYLLRRAENNGNV